MALDVACRNPHTGEARDALRAALHSQKALVVARAAAHVRKSEIADMDLDLEQAFLRLLDAPAKADPSCRAKVALLEALDHLERIQENVFLAAARYKQNEPGFGAPLETATGVRSRAIAALSRIGFSDFLILAGEMLADPQAPVRQSTIEALAHHGDRAGAGLAMLKLLSGDSDPLVTHACMVSLLSLASDWAITTLRPMLFGKDEPLRELAALALGEARQEQALPTLFEFLESCVSPEDRSLALRAIGLSRLPQARDFLVDRVATALPHEAEAAVRALAPQRFEPGLSERVQEAARRNPQPISFRIIADAFGEP